MRRARGGRIDVTKCSFVIFFTKEITTAITTDQVADFRVITHDPSAGLPEVNDRPQTMKVRHGPGRPPKYGRPSRAVTLTLPEDVLARLAGIDSDLGQAVVKLVEDRPARRSQVRRSAELASYGNHAVIAVTPVKALKRLSGVQLVPLGNGRALISLQSPHSIPQLELDLRDALMRTEAGQERDTLEAIADILREARLARGVSLEERTIIVLESKRQRVSAASRNAAASGRRFGKRGSAG